MISIRIFHLFLEPKVTKLFRTSIVRPNLGQDHQFQIAGFSFMGGMGGAHPKIFFKPPPPPLKLMPPSWGTPPPPLKMKPPIET